MNIAPFVLYGLVGCQHCESAVQFLSKVGVPFSIVVANDDPVATSGVEKLLGESAYPVLIYRPTKEYVKGFEADKYEKLTRAFYAAVGASIPSVFGSGQSDQSQVPVETQATETVAGAA